MPTTLHTPDEVTFEEVIRQRKELGHDLYDEVWEGEYVIMNVPANRHQVLVADLSAALVSFIDRERGDFVLPGVNVTDRDDWKSNYRIPDVAVYLVTNPAQDRRTHYFGGPDLAIEIVSPGDRTREKFDFYARVGTRELIVIDEGYERFEFFRLDGGTLAPAGTLTPGSPPIATESVPLAWRLDRTDRLRLSLAGDSQTQTILIG